MARAEANAGTQRDKGIHHLQGLEGKRVAMVAGFFLEDTVRREHPRIRLQLYPDLAQALASVAADDSDAFVGNDYAARYANAQQLGNQLQLTGILEDRSEEHTSELQSHLNLVCRLLLEKKNKSNDH